MGASTSIIMAKVNKTYVVVEIWTEFLEALKQIHLYLDTCEGKKRLAVDTETYICAEAREVYNVLYSLKKMNKKNKDSKAWAEVLRESIMSGVWPIDYKTDAPPEFIILEDPDLPIPEPEMNRWGMMEGRVRLIQIGINPQHIDIQYLIDLDKIYATMPLHWEKDRFGLYEEVGEQLQPLFDKAIIIGQNLKYEYKFFWAYFKCKMKIMRDLFLMSQRLWMGDKINHKLSNLYKLYIDKEKFGVLIGFEPVPYEDKEVVFSTIGIDEETGERQEVKEYEPVIKWITDPFVWYEKFKGEEQKFPWYKTLGPNQHKYASEDVRLPWYVFERLLELCTEWANKYPSEMGGFLEVIKNECALIPALAKAEVVGIPFNKDYYLNDLKAKIQAEIDEAQAAVDKQFKKVTQKKKSIGRGKDKVIEFYDVEESYNLGSWQQIRALTGLSKEVLETTGADDLLFFKGDHPAVKWIIQYKKAQKKRSFFESTERGYLTKLDANNFVHVNYHSIGVEGNTVSTGRLSASDFNIMQVPSDPDIRAAFAAPEGWKFVIADFNQLQLRIGAEICDDPFLKTIFKQNRDLHAETAKLIFNLDYLPSDKSNPEHVKIRKMGKTIRFAKVFQMGNHKFMKSVYVDTDGELDYILRGEEGEAEAKLVCNRLDEASPGMTSYRTKVENEVKALPYKHKSFYPFRDGTPFYVSQSMYGGTRRFSLLPEERKDVKAHPEDWDVYLRVLYEKTGKVSTWANNANSKIRDAAREAFNNEIQSTEADIFKPTIIEVNEAIEDLIIQKGLNPFNHDIVLIMFVHDELCILCREEFAEQVKSLLESKMIQVGSRFIKSIPVEVSGDVVDNWSQKG